MANRIVIGIDPGLSGALCLLKDGGDPIFIDMPVIESKRKGSKKPYRNTDRFALSKLVHNLRKFMHGTHFFSAVEVATTRPGEGGASTLKIGTGYGILLGVLAGAGIEHCTVTSQAWKKHHGLIGASKDGARQLALAKFPEQAGLWLNRKKDNGRADALMIALWAHETEAWIS